MSVSASPPRAWQLMLSGRRLDLLNPQSEDIEADDIALGLSRVARWNGQTKGAYSFSVAQHSLLVESIFSSLNPQAHQKDKLAALLHDAPEYVVGDMISPFKAVIGADYKAVEKRLLGAIHKRFNIPAETPSALISEIKNADGIAAYHEAVTLAGFDEQDALKIFNVPPRGLSIQKEFLDPMPAEKAKAVFLDRLSRLLG
ncbi:MAG: hydrolase [Alphaproteobacteria bacterium]